MTTTIHIYLETVEPIVDRHRVHITLESYVCLFVHRYLDANTRLYFVEAERRDHTLNDATIVTIATENSDSVYCDLSDIVFEILSHADYNKRLAALCIFPVLVCEDTNVVVAGLCGVCRSLVRFAGERYASLLGFKGGCMLAPSEQSVWTRFVEIEVPSAVRTVLAAKMDNDDVFVLPAEFGRFETHMGQPVRMHNIYKVARDLKKANQKLNGKQVEYSPSAVENLTNRFGNAVRLNVIDTSSTCTEQLSSSVPMGNLGITHSHAECQQLTLADLMLFACFGLALDHLGHSNVCAQLFAELPRMLTWMDTIRSELHASDIIMPIRCESGKHLGRRTLRCDLSDVRSLYKNDSKRYKPRSQIFTKPPDIEAALAKVHRWRLNIRSDGEERFSDADFAWWRKLPFDALPEGGALPPDRLQRKQHQLQSLAVEVLRLARSGDRVVDFCSGAGHLGIVVAVLRPDCEVVLLENKEESLQRARERVERLGLTNVRYFQCNLDYFCGSFNVGVSLHACGVATDIVLEHCMRQRASFVCCPCCYGGCKSTGHIHYPRSLLFANGPQPDGNSDSGGGLSAQECMHVAHCADQAHDVRSGPCNEEKAAQGQLCMDVMDWDRKLCAEERGYTVVLTRLQPENCTQKNRLLVGTL